MAASQRSARIQRAPEWGIEPVPPELRRLGFLDQAVLWGNLGVSLLVLVAGALLVPALGLWPALAATVVGAAIGNALLGLAAVPAAETGVPAMVLYRAPLGVRGSLVPTACNVVQNLGWATFELFVIATAATAISERVLGFGGRPLWVLVFGLVATAMAVAGPLTVLRRWLERFAIWAVLASTAYLTWYALARFDLGRLADQPGQGGLSFWAGVDLAIALPISWVPLVADYARFGRSAGATFWGTGIGYLLAQVWFFALGVLFLLGIGQGDVIAAVLAVPVGLLAMAVLVVDETDEVFANLYSAGVSLKNAAPRLPGRRVVLAFGAVATLLAILVDDLARYENFLFLLGALFVPLFGVLAADWYVLARRRYDVDAMYRADGPYRGVRWLAMLVWLLGFLVYNWINPGTVTAWVSLVEGLLGGLLNLPFPLSARLPWLGASVPAFLVAFLAMLAVGRRRGREGT
ncbi:MAG TPA: cytosine permease [Actinomycetes bacterium]|jgi:putative hydroxymethylpyrimidine transporter CytX|nr:cytosine permease [Actinomycetes bacterium]